MSGGVPAALPEWLVPQRDRLARWATLCAAGHCRYATLAASEEHPLRSGDTCPGYAGTLHHEDGQPLMRVGWCVRRRAWGVRRRAWLHAQREKPTRKWREEEG